MATFDSRGAAEFDPLAPLEHVPGRWRTGLGPGLLGGAVMLFVLVALAIASRVSPLQPLRLVASTILGPRALDGGIAPAVLGLAIHVAVSAVLGMLFSRLVGRTTMKRTLGLGLAYGLAIWALAQLFIVPLVAPDVALQPGTIGPFLLAHASFGLIVAAGLPVVADIDAPPPRVPGAAGRRGGIL